MKTFARVPNDGLPGLLDAQLKSAHTIGDEIAEPSSEEEEEGTTVSPKEAKGNVLETHVGEIAQQLADGCESP